LKIIVAVRCLNEESHIDRFLRQYSFADLIVVSDGGSTDGSIKLLKDRENVELIHFEGGETIDGEFWNTDAPHMNFVLDKAKSYNPDWLIFDDMDSSPNKHLRENARQILEDCDKPQVNIFRLYMWGDGEYFPFMNRDFNINYTSLWAWKPSEINIYADRNERHGTILGTTGNRCDILPPAVLLHRSWRPDTIEKKIERYNKLGIKMGHPLQFAGNRVPLPYYAREE